MDTQANTSHTNLEGRSKTDSQLMENRRKLILSLCVERSRSFVHHDRIIPRLGGGNRRFPHEDAPMISEEYLDKREGSTVTFTPSLLEESVGIGVSQENKDDDPELIEVRRISRFGLGSNEDPSKIAYLRTCRHLEIKPVAMVTEGLSSDALVVESLSVGPLGTKAIAIAMVDNCSVCRLVLHDVGILDAGARAIGDMLTVNNCITTLTLSNNGITTKGLVSLMHGLQKNRCIESLDLSGNGFTDNDAVLLANFIKTNSYMERLVLSHNHFCERGGELIGSAIGINRGIEYIDLSWNHIRKKGAVKIAEGLKKNSCITDLNLAWNGFSMEGSAAIGRALSRNVTLKNLDLTNNRINLDCLVYIVKGLRSNTTLKTLRLGQNPVTSDGALYLIDTIIQVDSIGLNVLDLRWQAVDKKFMAHLAELKKKRNIEVYHDVIISQDDSDPSENIYVEEDPMLVLMEFMKLKNMRLLDLFKQLDTDNSFTLSREELDRGLKTVNIPLSQASIDNLLDELDEDGDGEIDFRELLEGQKEYRKRLRLQKERTKKQQKLLQERGLSMDGKEIEDDVTRINRKLSEVMKLRERVMNNSPKQPDKSTGNLNPLENRTDDAVNIVKSRSRSQPQSRTKLLGRTQLQKQQLKSAN